MIRRVFWLSVGAAAGITGYRRATAMGRTISVRLTGERSGAAPGPFWPPQPNTAGRETMAGREATAVRAQARSRAGDQARAKAGDQWNTARMAWRTSRAVWRAQKAAITQVRSAGRFARDVREGMDLYMSRQDGQPGPTLARAPEPASAPNATGNPRPPARP